MISNKKSKPTHYEQRHFPQSHKFRYATAPNLAGVSFELSVLAIKRAEQLKLFSNELLITEEKDNLFQLFHTSEALRPPTLFDQFQKNHISIILPSFLVDFLTFLRCMIS